MKKITIILTVLFAMTITFNDKLSKIVHACKLYKEKQNRLYLYSIMNLFLILLSTSCISPLMTAVNKNNTKEAETLINNVADNNPKVTVPVVNNDNGQVQKNTAKEKIFIPSLRIIKPIPRFIPETALSFCGNPSHIKEPGGNIASWGFGAGADAKVHKDFRLFFDMTGYSFKQELVEKGGTGYCLIDMGSDIYLPLGAKYKTYTTAMRLGVKYVYTKSEKYQPWVGVAYGLNVWNVKYVTWDEDEVYGKANGATWRSSILFGIDLKLKDVATFTFFFDAISPVADYTMTNLFGLGDFHQFDAMTFPTPRIGISIGGF